MNDNAESRNQVSRYIDEYRIRYLETPKGRKHLEYYDKERHEVRTTYDQIREKFEAGEDITDLVLYNLLPHSDNAYNREMGHRISTWPVIQKDIKTWYENAGWQVPENWPKVAKAIFELVMNCEREPSQASFDHFKKLDYIKGFESGMLSPIFYCLRPEMLVLNSKNRDTVNFLFALLGKNEKVDTYLINYLDNISLIQKLLDELSESLFKNYDVFDMFCHFMCSKRLGGYVRKTKVLPPPRPEPDEALLISEEETGTPGEEKSHVQIQWMLIELGANLGCDVWIARNDQGKSFKGVPFSDRILARLPKLGFDENTTRIIEYIDVIWLKGNAIVAAFEVEHTTSIYSGILRLSDLVTMQPNVNIDLFIITPEERYDKVVRELNRPTFSSYALRLNERCKFISYEALDQVLQETARYAGYVDARVIHKVAKSCTRSKT